MLLDPTSPWEAHLPALHTGRVTARAGTAAAGVLATGLAVTGATLRRVGVRVVTRAPDRLPHDVARARYGSREAWTLLAHQWFASWEQAPRVRDLLDDGRRLPAGAEPLLVTGLRASARFLRAQRELSDRLGVPRVGLAGEGHLYPLTRPDAVARLATDLAPDAGGATARPPG